MPGTVSRSLIDEISRRVDILDLVGSYVSLSNKGSRWWGLCPFHTEKTPSFSVSPDSNLYYCFGCQKGGNVFRFLMEIEGLSFPEALNLLAKKVGIELPSISSGSKSDSNVLSALEELHEKVADIFRWLLRNSLEARHARDYLSKRRIDEETAELYKIGWAPSDGEWLYNFLLKKNYSPEFLGDSGLFSLKSPKWSFFVDRIMFPIMPDIGRVVAFSGRSLNENAPKYINSRESAIYKKSKQLYGLAQAKQNIRQSRSAVICEGNMDVLACAQAGIREVIAPLGTAFTTGQARIIGRYADSMIILYDGDDAGRAAAIKTAVLAESIGLPVNAVRLPIDSDPADILISEGAAELKKMVRRPISVFTYLLNSFADDDKLEVSGHFQEKFLKELAPYLNAVDSEIRREAYLRQLADTIKADPITVIREYRYQQGRKQAIPSSKKLESIPIDDELYLMTAVAVKTEHFENLKQHLAPVMLRNKKALAVYRVMDELYADDRKLRTETIVRLLDDEELKKYILKNALAGIYDENAEKTITEKILALKARWLNEERSELIRSLSASGKENESRDIARITRIQAIDKEILSIRQGKNG